MATHCCFFNRFFGADILNYLCDDIVSPNICVFCIYVYAYVCMPYICTHPVPVEVIRVYQIP